MHFYPANPTWRAPVYVLLDTYIHTYIPMFTRNNYKQKQAIVEHRTEVVRRWSIGIKDHIDEYEDQRSLNEIPFPRTVFNLVDHFPHIFMHYMNALSYAAYCGHIDIVELLLDQGAGQLSMSSIH